MKLTNQWFIKLALTANFILLAGCNGNTTLSAETKGDLSIENAQPVNEKTLACKIGLNPFPYDLVPQAIFKTANTTRSNGDLYTVQLDNGIPWQEALEGKPFSREIMETWERHLVWKAKHQSIHLAIAPLSMDRKSWAGDHDGKTAPKWVRDADGRVTDDISKAYTNFVRRAVEYFKPEFLNIGVEAMDLAHNNAKNWVGVQDMLIDIQQNEKRARPNMQVGLSIGLPLLMQPEIFERTIKALNASDYLGASFYPHLGAFYKKIGGVPLQSPPQQWTVPFDWLKDNIVYNKSGKLKKGLSIAFSETAYSSDSVDVDKWGLGNMPASKELQAEYVIALAKLAKELEGNRNSLIFVNFFLPIDYDALVDRIGTKDNVDFLNFWKRSGFFDKNLNPKPAWDAYQDYWLNRTSTSTTTAKEATSATPEAPASAPAKATTAASSTVPVGGIIFEDKKDLFLGASSSKFSLEKGPENFTVMKWVYPYKKGEWAWAVKDFELTTKSSARRLSFYAKSDRTDPVIVQLIEKGGEAFFAQIKPTKNWGPIEIKLSDMSPDPQKKQNGELEINKIKSIMLADGASEKKEVNGSRTILITSPLFYP